MRVPVKGSVLPEKGVVFLNPDDLFRTVLFENAYLDPSFPDKEEGVALFALQIDDFSFSVSLRCGRGQKQRQLFLETFLVPDDVWGIGIVFSHKALFSSHVAGVENAQDLRYVTRFTKKWKHAAAAYLKHAAHGGGSNSESVFQLTDSICLYAVSFEAKVW